jgi:serralysin
LEAEGLAHYQSNGYAEGRPTDSFDVDQYLANYADLRSAFSDGHGGENDDAATAHYIDYGYFEHRLAQDPLDYIASNADLIAAFHGGTEAQLDAEGLAHYQSNGYGEGRPTDSFDVDQYLANYADLRAAFSDGHGGYNDDAALLHYIDTGYFEGRTDHVLTA